jgi:hypothetical protein
MWRLCVWGACWSALGPALHRWYTGDLPAPRVDQGDHGDKGEESDCGQQKVRHGGDGYSSIVTLDRHSRRMSLGP